VLSLIEKTQYLVFLLKLPTSSNMLLRLTIIVDDCECFIPKNKAKTSH